MNERIKLLFEQAHIQPPATVSGQFAFTPPKTFSPEKFAELIIKECAGVCQTHGWGMLEHGMSGHNIADDCGTLIKEHFGVEE